LASIGTAPHHLDKRLELRKLSLFVRDYGLAGFPVGFYDDFNGLLILYFKEALRH
jgi:hypothetical protein